MDANNSNADVMPIEVALPDGSIVDITTKEGANAFLEGVSSFDHFSSKLKEIRKLRKKKRLSARDKEKLVELFSFISFLAQKADREIFRAKIPQSEIQDWLNYIIEEIKCFTKKRHWISTGRLKGNDYNVLLLCDRVLCSGQVVPVYLAFESEFFQVLANFIEARKAHGGRALPHVDVCVHIGQTVHCCLRTAHYLFDNSWPKEKIFKKFEASGVLEQILRCSTLAKPWEVGSVARFEHPGHFNLVLKDLESCASILAGEFKTGEPCGDTLKAILDGRDGNRNPHPVILNQLQGIARLVETMDAKEFKAISPFSKCSHCFKTGDTEAPLLCCSGCRIENYCSRECQKADWQKHKYVCHKYAKPLRDNVIARQMATLRFLEQNFETFYEELDKKCDSTGLDASGMVVEIDFMPNGHGIIPALHDPPIFKIAPIQDYFSGRETPEWLRDDALTNREVLAQIAKCVYMSGVVGFVSKSISPMLLLQHANRTYLDEEIIGQFRQGDMRTKLET